MYSWRSLGWLIKNMYSDLEIVVFLYSSSIAGFFTRCGTEKFAFDCEKTISRYLYILKMMNSSKNCIYTFYSTCIILKYLASCNRKLKSNSLSILLRIKITKFCHWIDIDSNLIIKSLSLIIFSLISHLCNKINCLE